MNYASLSSTLVQRPIETTENTNKRRSLVLTDEGAKHPFRGTLPPRVRKELHDIPAESLWRLTAEDVRGAVSTYVATTAAILVFIM